MSLTRRQFVQSASLAVCASRSSFCETQGTAAIAAAIAAHESAVLVHRSWVRDPFIALGKDGTYYYTGTTQSAAIPETEATLNNTGLGDRSLVGSEVRLWQSQDLVQWTLQGSIASLRDTVYYSKEREHFDQTPANRWNIWAPELHQREDNRWAIIFTVPRPLAPEVGAGLLLSRGTSLSGPWDNPLGLNEGQRHDPSLFRDDDGTWWVISTATRIQPLKPDWSDYAGPPVTIGPAPPSTHMGHEGCTILKIHGKYVLFGTGWSTGHRTRHGSYNLYYSTADKVTGPYGPRRLAGRFLGHGTPFQDKQGRWWCTAFFNADVPPLAVEGIEHRDLHEAAQTINKHGLTLVPMDVIWAKGDVTIRAKDPHYAIAGPDEAPAWTDDEVAGWKA